MKYSIIGSFLLLALVFSCKSSQKMDVPENFVKYKKESKSLKAITAEGVRLRTFSHKNEPVGDLNLWKLALKEQLSQTGYRITGEGELKTTTGLAGYYFETVSRYQNSDYAYLVALFVKEDKVYTVESAGLLADFTPHKDAVIKAMGSFEGN